jgi:hypothetical protein
MVDIKNTEKKDQDDSNSKKVSTNLEWIFEIVNEASTLIDNEFGDSSNIKTRPNVDSALKSTDFQSNERLDSTRKVKAPALFYESQHPAVPSALEESTNPYCDFSKEKARDFIGDFKHVHSSDVGIDINEHENRAMGFHAHWYGEAVSFCAFRAHEGKWCEVIKPWSNSKNPGVDSRAWSLLHSVLCQESSEQPSSLMIRHHSDLFVVVYEHPYVCVHQHNLYNRVRLLRELSKLL